jgi:hypothetical protein
MPQLFKKMRRREGQEVADAIATLSTHPTEGNRQALYRELLQCSLFLATASLPPGWADRGAVTLDQATTLPTLTSPAPDGTKALLAFTDHEHVRRRKADASSFAMESRAVLELVLAGDFGALIINPSGPWAAIPRADVQTLLGTL